MCLIEDFKTFVEQNISAEIIKLKNKEAAETIFFCFRGKYYQSKMRNNVGSLVKSRLINSTKFPSLINFCYDLIMAFKHFSTSPVCVLCNKLSIIKKIIFAILFVLLN